MKKVYQAYGAGCQVIRDTPRSAAIAFFENFPSKRKCSVTEGVKDGAFFTVSYGRDEWPISFRDVTKKMAATLPDDKPQE